MTRRDYMRLANFAGDHLNDEQVSALADVLMCYDNFDRIMFLDCVYNTIDKAYVEPKEHRGSRA
jgi:hypothetical protein